MSRRSWTSGFKRSRAENAGKPCIEPGCEKLRHGIGEFCSAHADRKRLYGHQRGRSITLAEVLKLYYIARRALVRVKKSHPEATQRALSLINEIVFTTTSAPPPGHAKGFERLLWEERRRMRKALRRPSPAEDATEKDFVGWLTLDECLARIAAVWVLFELVPLKLPDDVRLDYALARIVLLAETQATIRMAWKRTSDGKDVPIKGVRSVPGKVSKYIGKKLRDGLARFWVTTMLPAMQARAQEVSARVKAKFPAERWAEKDPLVVAPWKVVRRRRASHHLSDFRGTRMEAADKRGRPNYIKLVQCTVPEPEPVEEVSDAELHAVARELNLDLAYAIGRHRAEQAVLERRRREREQGALGHGPI